MRESRTWPSINALARAALALALALSSLDAARAATPEGLVAALAEVSVNGVPRGSLEFFLDDAKRPRIPASALRELLGGIAKPELLAAIAGRERLVSSDELAIVGIGSRYDQASLELRLELAPRALAPRDLSPRKAEAPGAEGSRIAPEPLSALLGLDLRADPLVYGEPTGPILAGSGSLGLSPSLNLLGFVAEGRARLSWDESFSYDLEAARLVRDLPSIGARLSGGIVGTRASSFQAEAELVGLSLYREPSIPLGDEAMPSSGEILLERKADVAIAVNGVAVRRLRLGPGSYRLSDLPLSSGLNDVVVEIAEEGRAPRRIKIGRPFDAAILAPGKLDYSLSLGMDRASLSRPLGAASLSAGIGRYLELGADAEAGFGSFLGGASLLLATPLGNLGAAAALALPYEGEAAGLPGYAARLSWRFAALGATYAPKLGAGAEYRGPGFSPPAEEASLEPPSSLPSWRLSAQLGQALPGGAGSLGAFGNALLEGGELSGLSLSAGFFLPLPGSVSLSLSGGWDWSALSGGEPRASISLSVAPPDRRVLQYRNDLVARSDSFDASFALDPAGTASIGLRGEGLAGGAGPRSAAIWGRGGLGPLDLSLSAHYLESAMPGPAEYGASLDASTVLALAGGHFAASSAFGEAFAILVPSASLGGATVELRPRRGAVVASLGGKAALVSGIKPYEPFVASIETPDSPPEIRPDRDLAEIYPTYRSITIIEVGAASAIAVRGRLVDGSGAPKAFIAGDLLDPQGSPLPGEATFTDGAGAFECYGLAAGPVRIRWSDGSQSRFLAAPRKDSAAGSGAGFLVELGDIAADKPAQGSGRGL